MTDKHVAGIFTGLINSPKTARVAQSAFLSLIYVIVSAFVLNAFVQRWDLGTDSKKNDFATVMEYKATRPFVYRVLVPFVVNTTASAIPDRVVHRFEDTLLHTSRLVPNVRIKDTPEWTVDVSLKYHLTYFFLFFCLFSLLYTTRYLTRVVFSPPTVFQDFGPAVALLLLPLTFLEGGYIYDFPELLLMALLLVCIVKSKWWLFYPVFVLAILNKEADVLLILFFLAFHLKTMPRPRLSKHLLAQIVISGMLLFLVRNHFASVGGSPVEDHMIGNLRFWANPLSYLKVMDIYARGILVPRGFNILSLLLVVFMLSYRWREKPIEIRFLFFFALVINLPLSILFGYQDEIRNLSLIFLGLYLMGFHTLTTLYTRDSEGKKSFILNVVPYRGKLTANPDMVVEKAS
jgi:hypothetical protein